MAVERWRAATLVLIALVGWPASVNAFCRTTTCDRMDAECRLDEHDCVVDGVPLAWFDRCPELWLPEETEPLDGIGLPELAAVTERSLSVWNEVECGDERKPVAVMLRLGGHAQCAKPGYDPLAQRNINSLSIVREGWPLNGRREVALTTLTYDPDSGEILDADIELNADHNVFTIGDENVRQDLESALTHELGHLLGLDHSDVPNATLSAQTTDGATGLRSLAADDRDAVCSAYPPELGAPECALEPEEPRTVCVQVAALTRARRGCAVAFPLRCTVFGDSTFAVLALFALLGLRLRSRRRAVPRQKHK